MDHPVILEMKGIVKSFGPVRALKGVNFDLRAGEVHALMGENGAGKSTLLKGMLGIIDHVGQTYLDDKEFSKVLSHVAYVEQKIHIDYNFPIKVKECVSLGLYPKVKLFHRLTNKEWEKVTNALRIVGLEDYAKRQISQLSGGQFQRVLIARCLVQEADCIFLDEPFVGIDSISEEIIMTTLRSLKEQGKTILIVHHDLGKVPHYFDQVLILNKELIAIGETSSTFTEENLKKAYGSQLFVNGGL